MKPYPRSVSWTRRQRVPMLKRLAVNVPFAQDRVPLIRKLLQVGRRLCRGDAALLTAIAVGGQLQAPTPGRPVWLNFEAPSIEVGRPILPEILCLPSTIDLDCGLAMSKVFLLDRPPVAVG